MRHPAGNSAWARRITASSIGDGMEVSIPFIRAITEPGNSAVAPATNRVTQSATRSRSFTVWEFANTPCSRTRRGSQKHTGVCGEA
jgi:hypothetical protein